jgi:esterase
VVMPIDLAHLGHGATGAPVVILHGLFGSARNWATVARRLAARHRVVALDLRNHGQSPWAATMGFDEMAEDVRAFMVRHDLAPAAVIGHSLGGKVAMRLALEHADHVTRLVVVDVAPVTYTHSLGQYVDAMRRVPLDGVARRAEVDAALGRTIGEPALRAFLLQNLVRDDGGYRWRINLEAIAHNLPRMMAFPPSARLCYPGPTLVLAGGLSHYVQDRHRPAIARLFPNAELVTIAAAGHRVHVDQPGAFLQRVGAFLA